MSGVRRNPGTAPGLEWASSDGRRPGNPIVQLVGADPRRRCRAPERRAVVRSRRVLAVANGEAGLFRDPQPGRVAGTSRIADPARGRGDRRIPDRGGAADDPPDDLVGDLADPRIGEFKAAGVGQKQLAAPDFDDLRGGAGAEPDDQFTRGDGERRESVSVHVGNTFCDRGGARPCSPGRVRRGCSLIHWRSIGSA